MELRARKDVPVEETWDLSLIFENEEQMWAELEKTKTAVRHVADTYAGRLNTAGNIVGCLDEMEQIGISLSRIWSYTSLAVETDYTDNGLRELDERVSDEVIRLERDTSFVDSEILLAPEEVLREALEQAKGCRIYLQDLTARKAHMLSPETEKTLAALGKSLNVPYTVYNTMKLAEFPSNRLR